MRNIKEARNVRLIIYRSENHCKGETKERQILKMSYGTGDINNNREVSGKNV